MTQRIRGTRAARLSLAFAHVVGVVIVAAAIARAEVPSPLSPADSLAHLQVEPGLAIELVACEPEVVDPIAIRFDEDGRLWVVEMRDYPHGPPDGQPPLSRIRVLTDTDNDGRFETSRLFADELLFPTGLQPWRGGVFVTLAETVMFLKDTDGDGRADLREPWFRGFTAENPQLRANHPRLGLDGRITVANGLRGGAVIDVHNPQEGAEPLSISGRDFAFDPRTGAYEAISGNGQFGNATDDFGNRFVCNNRAPLQHVVLENKYTARNPLLAVGSVVHDAAPAGELSRVFPRTAAWTTSNLHAGQFTAACGVTIYRGDALGEAFYGNAFICEPTGSLVHREIVAPDCVTFAAHAAYEDREFLSSDDPWFRPVNLQTGPDGALYVVDMHRAVIEHPQFMPSELQERPDLHKGNDRGRIYRIVPAGNPPRRVRPRLSGVSTPELVPYLRHPNAWWRETAARLLIEREDNSIAAALTYLAAAAPEPFARVQAVWLLENLRSLSPGAIAAALADPDARVRDQAIKLAESRLADNVELRAKVISAATDPDARVRFRAALALGGLSSDEVVTPLSTIALAGAEDHWTRTAVATALPQHTGPILGAVLAAVNDPSPSEGTIRLVHELATTLGAGRDPAAITPVLTQILTISTDPLPLVREAALTGLAEGLARRGQNFSAFVDMLPGGDELKLRRVELFRRVAAEASDQDQPEQVRLAKIALLAFDRSETSADVLLSLATQSPQQTLRVAAAEALAGHPSAKIASALVAAFAAQTPAVRRAYIDALMANPQRAALLLDELDAGRIARNEIDAARADRLKNSADSAVQKRAAKLLAQSLPAERQRVLDDYRTALKLQSNPASGKELFTKHCATCHRIAGIGVDVAPDISDSRVKLAEQLLVDILNPNQAIDNNYASYTVVMQDGAVHTGIIAAETAGSITLRQPEDKRLDLLRADVELIRTSGASLMPEGFEKQLTHQQMADLISFIKNWRYLEQPIPGTLSGKP
jgi:putative membrane-bound dehydrogenase-like protein